MTMYVLPHFLCHPSKPPGFAVYSWCPFGQTVNAENTHDSDSCPDEQQPPGRPNQHHVRRYSAQPNQKEVERVRRSNRRKMSTVHAHDARHFLLKLIFVEELGVCFCRLLLNASHASTSLIWPRLHGGNARSTERVVEWHLGSHDRVAAVWFGDRNCRFRLAGP